MQVETCLLTPSNLEGKFAIKEKKEKAMELK